jgi:outer membrane protein, multidrug efflux system
MKILLPLLGLPFLFACAQMPKIKPEIAKSQMQVPQAFPNMPQSQILANTVKWRDFYQNKNLIKAIEYGLLHNVDLKIAALNLERAKNNQKLARISQLPSLRANSSIELSGKSGDALSDNYAIGLAMPSYEIDLFGRLQSLEKAAEYNFFASSENQSAIKITLIANIANAWVNISSDLAQIEIIEANIKSLRASLKIVEGRQKYGIASDLEINAISAQLNELSASLLANQTKLENDKSILVLLCGGEGALQFLPPKLEDDFTIAQIGIDIPSNVLLARPDIRAAEANLLAQNANIDAARAQKFPSINLIGSTGFASGDLLKLLSAPKFAITPNVSIPIFDNGIIDLNIENAKINRDIAIQNYEKVINSAFNDISQALNIRAQIANRIATQESAVKNYQKSVYLATRRFEVGIDNYLPLLIAQRNFNNAQANLLNLRTLAANNLISLYSALGNDASLGQ